MAEKITKREMFEEVKAVIMAIEDYDRRDEVVEFLDKQIAALDARAEKAKERAAKAKEEGDALKEAVEAVITAEWQTADAIALQLMDEEITKAKVVARLTQLFKEGVIEKETQKVESGRRVMCYKLK